MIIEEHYSLLYWQKIKYVQIVKKSVWYVSKVVKDKCSADGTTCMLHKIITLNLGPYDRFLAYEQWTTRPLSWPIIRQVSCV
jgi:hypothetical protein